MPKKFKYQRRCKKCKMLYTTDDKWQFSCHICEEEIKRLEEMTIYKAIKCDNCNKAFMTTRKERYKCSYCGKETIKHVVITESNKPKDITETVAQYNYKNR